MLTLACFHLMYLTTLCPVHHKPFGTKAHVNMIATTTTKSTTGQCEVVGATTCECSLREGSIKNTDGESELAVILGETFGSPYSTHTKQIVQPSRDPVQQRRPHDC
jgi:hypothetical protein